jgi:hypothetical protein
MAAQRVVVEKNAQMMVMVGRKVAEGGKRAKRVKLPGTAICRVSLQGS